MGQKGGRKASVINQNPLKPSCMKCDGEGEELHACPYDADVNDDDTPTCPCCEECQEECADDI